MDDHPVHVHDDGDCDCVACDAWRSEQVTRGSLVRSYRPRGERRRSLVPIWRPETPVLWDIKMGYNDIAMVIDRHYHHHMGRFESLDAVMILIPGNGFWITMAKKLIVLVRA